MTTINNGVLDGVRRIGATIRDLSISGGIAGAPLGVRLRGATVSGAPVTGTWKAGDQVSDRSGAIWTCTAGGTPGTWVQSGGGAALAQTAVQTGNYTASANQVVRVSTTAGPVTVTLPNAPAAGTLDAVKLVTLGIGNAVTVACAGSDVFNVSGGGTTGTLTLLNQGMLLQYQPGSPGVWVVLSDDLPLSQLNALFVPLSDLPLSIPNGGTGTATGAPQNDVFAGPATGGAGAPAFRALTAADVPALNQNTTGTAAGLSSTLAIGSGGTGHTTAAAAYNALSPMTTTGDMEYDSAGGTAARLPVGAAGQVLGVSGGVPAWTTQVYGGLFGDGSDGAVAFNGTNTSYSFASWSSGTSTYTLTRDVYATSVTVSSGITVLPCAATGSQPNRLFVAGTLTNNGTISCNGTSGGNGASGSGGAGGLPGSTYASGGGNGGTSTATNGGSPLGSTSQRIGGFGTGGNGGAGNSTTGATGNGTSSTLGSWIWRSPYTTLSAYFYFAQSLHTPYGSGGGAGGGDGTTYWGGGGGGCGGILPIFAEAIVNNGVISANGGNGGNGGSGTSTATGGGGGGAGGVALLYTLSAVTGSGTFTASGGSPGTGGGTGASGTAGTSGAALNIIVT